MKKIMFKSALLALAAPLFLASCSSDSNDEPINGGEKFQGIMLSIPNIQTRATDNEMAINKLKVVVYDANNTATPIWSKDLSGSDVSGINTTAYKSIPVALAQGDYKMYLVANIDGYNVDKITGSTTWDSISEDDLKAAKITGLSAINATDLGTNYLPLGCSNAELKVNAADAETLGASGTIRVSSGASTTVYADLTYCVAKVNVTVTNASLPEVTFSSLKLNPYSTTSGLVANNSDLSKGTTDVVLAGTKENYQNGWKWGGTWYVAENLYDNRDAADKTKLNFSFSNSTYDKTRVLGEVTTDGVTTTTGVKRGYEYNVNGTISGKDLTIQVAVKEWKYFKSVQDLVED